MSRRLEVGAIAVGAAVLLGGSAFAAESPRIAYKLHCSGCHLLDGTGSKLGGIPPIPGVAGHFLRHEKGRLYLVHVPGLANSGLGAKESADLLNYIMDTWGRNDRPADASPFTEREVTELRAQRVNDIMMLRKEIEADLRKQGVDLAY